MTARTIPRPHTTQAAPQPDPTGRGSRAAPHRSRDAKVAGVLLSLAGGAACRIVRELDRDVSHRGRCYSPLERMPISQSEND